jgi:hypothetical protein
MPICGTALGARLYKITLDVPLCVSCTLMYEAHAYV